MLQLLSKELTQDTNEVLSKLQNRINQKPSFTQKVEEAQKLWTSKNKEAFEEVKQNLVSMCVSVEVCNYCEQSEANDIEHIYPKSFFPEFTFEWDNYLLACKQCNSGYKLDKCAVLDNNGNLINTTRGEEPTFKNVAMINPRTENPNEFMILNPMTFKFELLPDLTAQNNNKALKTLEILELNNRDLLISARKHAAIYFYDRMCLLSKIVQAGSINEIENLLSPHDDKIDDSQPINIIKNQIKESFRKHIIRYPHPSVWYLIKTILSKIDSKWKSIFDSIPDALHWS